MPTRRRPRAGTCPKRRPQRIEESGEDALRPPEREEETKMSIPAEKPLTFRFVDVDADVRLELSNETDHALKCVEILTVFLKDLDTPGGGPSQAHITFDQVAAIRAKENVVLSHKTWVNGKIA